MFLIQFLFYIYLDDKTATVFNAVVDCLNKVTTEKTGIGTRKLYQACLGFYRRVGGEKCIIGIQPSLNLNFQFLLRTQF